MTNGKQWKLKKINYFPWDTFQSNIMTAKHQMEKFTDGKNSG